MGSPLRIELLGPGHDRSSFSCSVEALDTYLKERASQDAKRRISNCFVALSDAGAIAGYYTLAAAGLPLTELDEAERKRLPRYPLLPAVLIGRLAVDSGHRRIGLGGSLVIDAAARCANSDPAVFALTVDAKDDAAESFYRHLGFRNLVSRPKSLFAPLATILRAAEIARGS